MVSILSADGILKYIFGKSKLCFPCVFFRKKLSLIQVMACRRTDSRQAIAWSNEGQFADAYMRRLAIKHTITHNTIPCEIYLSVNPMSQSGAHYWRSKCLYSDYNQRQAANFLNIHIIDLHHTHFQTIYIYIISYAVIMSGNYKTIELLVEICDGELAEIKKSPLKGHPD